MKRVGVLNLQGAVSEHCAMLAAVGVEPVQVKRPAELDALDGLILPGGESTAISRLLRQNGLTAPLMEMARHKPFLGTCAGLILLATSVTGDGGALPGENRTAPRGESLRPEPLGIMDITVARNGFGRQVDSFETLLDIPGIGADIPAVFIRPPYIEHVGPGVTVLAAVDAKIVMVETPLALGTAFHPELTTDLRVIRYFCAKL